VQQLEGINIGESVCWLCAGLRRPLHDDVGAPLREGAPRSQNNVRLMTVHVQRDQLDPRGGLASVVGRLKRDHAADVALTGDGGDEMFGGYRRHWTAAHVWPMACARRNSAASALNRSPLAKPPRRWIRRQATRDGPKQMKWPSGCAA
jgi:hypothetical protein